jgi:hypothetical protein
MMHGLKSVLEKYGLPRLLTNFTPPPPPPPLIGILGNVPA